MHVDPRQDGLSQGAWAARYAATLARLGVPKPLPELQAAGRALWLTASHRCPEDLALLEWRALFAAAGAVTCH